VNAPANSPASFVLLQLGGRRFALDADIVTELAPPVRLHTFPHTSDILAGVIVRRSRIVPVYDAGTILIGRSSSVHRFYLIARREFGTTSELSAIPVDGECELASGETLPREPNQPAYVKARFAFGDEVIDVLDFESVVTQTPAAAGAASRTEVPS
jgi:chemotaxis signal transduction protein